MVVRLSDLKVSRGGWFLELTSGHVVLVGLESVSVLVTSFYLTVLVFVSKQTDGLGCNRLSLSEINHLLVLISQQQHFRASQRRSLISSCIASLVRADISWTNSFLLRASKVVVSHNSEGISLTRRWNQLLILFMSLCKWRLNISALILLLLNVSTHLSIGSHCYHLLRYGLLWSRLINWACVFITDIRDSGKD